MRVRRIRNTGVDEGKSAMSSRADATMINRSAALTELEAATFIGMSAAWLKKSRTRRFRDAIDAPPVIRAGIKRVVYRMEDLEAWQERHLEHVGPGGADAVCRRRLVADDPGQSTA